MWSADEHHCHWKLWRCFFFLAVMGLPPQEPLHKLFTSHHSYVSSSFLLLFLLFVDFESLGIEMVKGSHSRSSYFVKVKPWICRPFSKQVSCAIINYRYTIIFIWLQFAAVINNTWLQDQKSEKKHYFTSTSVAQQLTENKIKQSSEAKGCTV